MRHLRTPAVMLDGVYCKSRYCGQRMFYPAAFIRGGGKSGWKGVAEAPAEEDMRAMTGKLPEGPRGQEIIVSFPQFSPPQAHSDDHDGTLPPSRIRHSAPTPVVRVGA